ncbi:hypothetical protein [Methylopila sp. M107]|uniref:hypothetical protein n=1 Tax=Methylopila sp. M107 TaxID=1101190 RepID=UPI0003714D7D|nr:hypothetical protein [Methylopila sp. M107]
MLGDLQILVDDFARDVAGRLGEPARDRALQLAVVQYGKDRPRTKVTDVVVGYSGAVRALELPSGWEIGASQPLTVEYPVGKMPPAIVPRHLWDVLVTPDGPLIGLPDVIVAGETCRLTWTLPHVLSDSEDTAPPADREAIAQYAASLLFDQAAAQVSGDGLSTIKSDSVDHGEQAPNFGKRAVAARARYHELLGIDPKRVQPASVTVAPSLPSTAGEDRLLFTRRRGW